MGYAYDESPFVPFNTPQVGPTVPSLPSPDMRDAEIAKLRLELRLAKNAAGYEPHEHADESATGFAWRIASLWKAVNDARSALAAARAALKVERDDSHKAYEIVCDEREKLHEALKIERACVDDYRFGHAVSHDSYESPTECRIYAGTDYRCDMCKDLDARRAAEANGEPK